MMLCNIIKDLSKINPLEYIFELKYDGCRALMTINNGIAKQLVNRNEQDILNKYPELQNLKISQLLNVVFDGELVVLKPNSFRCDFNALLSREHTQDSFKQKLLSKKYPVTFFAFDVLSSNGLKTADLDLMSRKEILNAYRLYENENFKIIPYFESLEIALKVMQYNESEGLILKKKDSKYENFRSDNWLKYKKRIEKIIRFNDYELNADNSVTLTDGFHRVKCNNPQIKKLIDFDGYAQCEVEGLELTKDGHIRFPILKRLV